ncbi:class I SAM-dependent methyltransferase [Algoriphagus sp. D3-2-R+10]|uniref:O-methyltransferase n=1 Tax=Algoriphagus aurantiacus TaxID=3103948 RepID=UPI002B3C0DF2|nr:class I SAM-dependent methyltransferase [Algoriphagus sp. D3-2-R+10]MEB2774530.1 class I SAM-dependent methyltransferase [Algoriphagus sp. D3-2-R+10]
MSYWLKKEDKYSLQSPLLFNTYQNLLSFIKTRKDADLEIESYRKNLLSSDQVIEVEDFGAGSKSVNSAKRRVSDITKFSTSNRKFAQLYQFFTTLTPAETVIELGTCMGISSRYLSKVTQGKFYTFEGSKEIARVAQPSQGFDNLTSIVGELSETLPIILATLEKVDFALIDATHTYEGTLRYFEQIVSKTHSRSIIAIGDIHWSQEMEMAWQKIKSKSEVRLSLDFYECGIVFFTYPGDKADYILDF